MVPKNGESNGKENGKLNGSCGYKGVICQTDFCLSNNAGPLCHGQKSLGLGKAVETMPFEPQSTAESSSCSGFRSRKETFRKP